MKVLRKIKTVFYAKPLAVCLMLLSSALVLVCAVSFVLSANTSAAKIRSEVLRFHVVANSNSAVDQAIKMKVRDGIADLTSQLFSTALTKQQAMQIAAEQLPALEKEAVEILAEHGSDSTVRVELRQRFFPTRHYDGISLPAGEYDTIDVLIGNGEGENFWCVMFPPVCVGAASSLETDNQEVMGRVLDGESYELITQSDNPKIKLKFKAVEIIQNIFHNIRI